MRETIHRNKTERMEKEMTQVLIILGILIVIMYILFKPRPQRQPIPTIPSYNTRPVILIIIDSLMDQPLQEMIRQGKAPALKFLIERGHYYPKVVSAFPTMSVSIDTTLLTGVPPNQHHIFGLTHFCPERKRVINYGTGMKECLAFGIKNVLTDSLKNLNQKIISKNVQTIHEAVDGPTASINALIYRGNIDHTLHLPLIAKLFGLPSKIKTQGPEAFSFGTLHPLNAVNQHGQPWGRYGMNDRFSRMEITPLIENKQLPPFTILYLPSNDDYLHAHGPQETKGIEKADRELQKILDAFSSWEKAINTTTFVVLGDSGHTQTLPDHTVSYVYLRKILSSYSVMPTKQIYPRKEDQIVLCVNERMGYIYILDDQLETEQIAKIVQQDERIDVIAWKEQETTHAISGIMDGELHYKETGSYIDEYEQSWNLQGDVSILDLTIDQEGKILYGEYPDALFRLNGVMETAKKVIVITCSPGYELVDDASPTHTGGSHGSLHYHDSHVPMVVTGTDTKPQNLRIIDLKEWVLSLMKENY